MDRKHSTIFLLVSTVYISNRNSTLNPTPRENKSRSSPCNKILITRIRTIHTNAQPNPDHSLPTLNLPLNGKTGDRCTQTRKCRECARFPVIWRKLRELRNSPDNFTRKTNLFRPLTLLLQGPTATNPTDWIQSSRDG